MRGEGQNVDRTCWHGRADPQRALSSGGRGTCGQRPWDRLRVPAEDSGMSLPMLAEDLSEGVTGPAALLGELHNRAVCQAC